MAACRKDFFEKSVYSRELGGTPFLFRISVFLRLFLHFIDHHPDFLFIGNTIMPITDEYLPFGNFVTVFCDGLGIFVEFCNALCYN